MAQRDCAVVKAGEESDAKDTWILCSLAEACSEINYGLTASASATPVGPRFLRITDIVSGPPDWSTVPFVAADDATAAKYRLYDGDIVIARTGASTGSSSYVKNPPAAVFASYLVRLRSKPEFDSRFISYYLKSERFQGYMRGVLGDKSAQPNASASTMAAAPFSAPRSLSGQRAIAHILGTLDDKIELNRRMNETLEEIARALFKSWFVDFDPVHAKATLKHPAFQQHSAPTGERNSNGAAPAGQWTTERARAYLAGMDPQIVDLFPDRLVDSELGKIPEGWKVKGLGEFARVVKGCSYRSVDLGDSNVALVTLKSVRRGGGYASDGLKAYTGHYRSQQIVKADDVIVAQTDVTQAAEVIGRTALVRDSTEYNTLVASLDLLIVRPQPPLTKAYVYRMLQGNAFIHHVLARVNGTTVLHMERDAVPGFEFPLPPQPLIDNFTCTVHSLDSLSTGNYRDSDNLRRQREVLLPKLIAGEVRMNDPS